MRAAFLSVWAVILSVAFVQAANGLQTDLIGIRADLASFPAWTIGLMMATYYVGYAVVPQTGRYVIGRIGHVRTIAVCATAAAAVIVTHPFLVTPVVWTGLRLVSGFVLSLVYVSFESWINDRAPNALRGRIFSIYIVAQMIALTLAQYLLTLGDPKAIGLFVLSGVLFVLAAAPVAIARRGAPATLPPVPLNVLKLFHVSPLGAIATVLAGMTWSIVFTFGPVYAQHVGFALTGIGLFMGLSMAAGGLLQFPLGWLSDIVGRRPVIAGMFVAGLGASLFGIWAVHRGVNANLVAAVLTGGFVFPMYAISVAHINDTIAPETRVAAAAGLILLYGLGSLFGPLLCGWAMTAMGSAGYFALLSVTMAAGAGVAARYR